MATYPNSRFANGQSFAVLYTDAKLSRVATITDLTGAPIPRSQIVAVNGLWPEFQYAGNGALYYRATDGTVDHLLPASTYTATAVTGAKSTQTAAVLGSLLSALATQGIITDNTTA